MPKHVIDMSGVDEVSWNKAKALAVLDSTKFSCSPTHKTFSFNGSLAFHEMVVSWLNQSPKSHSSEVQNEIRRATGKYD